MLFYSCTNIATVGVKGLRKQHCRHCRVCCSLTTRLLIQSAHLSSHFWFFVRLWLSFVISCSSSWRVSSSMSYSVSLVCDGCLLHSAEHC